MDWLWRRLFRLVEKCWQHSATLAGFSRSPSIDHASRACLRLESLADKSSLTLLRALATEPMADERGFTSALRDIRCWYNHDRPHDHLQGRTPAEVWAGIDVFAPRARTGRSIPQQESG